MNRADAGGRPASDAAPPDFSARRFLVGILLFTGLAVAGTAVAVAGRGGLDAFRVAPMPDPKLLAVAVALMGLDVWLSGLRVHHLAHRLAPAVTLKDAIRADLANRCVAGLTPSQSGGGPAQLYILARAGLSLSGGMAVGTINFLFSSVVLAILGFASLPVVHHRLPGWLRASTDAAVALLVATVAIGGWLIVRTRHRRLSTLAPGRVRRAFDRGVAFMARSLEIARRLFLVHRGPVLRILPITTALVAVKLVCIVAVFRAFVPEGHLSELIGVTVILVICLNFAPTPGGSGIVEGAGTAYLAGAIGPALSTGVVLYWRLLTAYVPLVLGGLILLAQLRRDTQLVRAARRNAPTRLDTPSDGT
ncbi:MAG: lysylphosphatidylglycerol synthase transmembrane domain-containing protein [Candidatus Eiseniibacteriota bacterium]